MVWFVLYPNISSMPSSGAGGGVLVPPGVGREVAQLALALALPSFFGLRGFGGNWLREQSGRRTVCGFSFCWRVTALQQQFPRTLYLSVHGVWVPAMLLSMRFPVAVSFVQRALVPRGCAALLPARFS